MALVSFTDRTGRSLPVLLWDGQYLSGYLDGHLKNGNLRDYLNEEDYSRTEILFCSYPRSGFHWIKEAVHMLINKTLSVNETTVADTVIEERVLSEHATSSPAQHKILNTHMPPTLIPDSLRKVKTIYIYRNPKDVAYSWYKRHGIFADYDGTFEDFVAMFLEGKVTFGSWFDHTLQWEKYCKTRDICVVSYEDMYHNSVTTLKKLAEYLEVDAEEQFLQAVIRVCSIPNMQCKNTRCGVLIRKGVAGGWKDHFTVAVNEQFDRVFKEKMKTSKLEFKFQ